MTGKTISPLRQRMIEDMTVRSFDPRTQSHYIRAVKKLTAFLGRSPDTADAEDLRRFQFHLRQTGVPAPTVNATVSALRFFFRVTVDRPEVVRHLAIVPKAHRLPVVLSPEEVARLLEAASEPKYKAALSLAYGAGLRVAEVASLKVSDIEFQTHAAARRTRQATQRPVCDALAEDARAAAQLVADRAAQGLAVSWP